MNDAQISERIGRYELESFTASVLHAAGVPNDHAECIAEGLVFADLRGVDSHGVARLETYVEKFEGGGFACDPDISVRELRDGVVFVDADHGPGHPAGVVAMDAAIERGAANGVGAAFVTNSNHFGAAAYFTQRAAAHDCIGIAMSNVGPDVIPFGGKRAFLGTNPLSIAVPSDRSFPVTLDMATSVVAMGKIDHVATVEDTEVPPDWGVDSDGNPTTDPHEVVALRPCGGPKGYGLAFMIDVLCGLLTGAHVSPDVVDLYAKFDEPMQLGHAFFAIDISALMDPTDFRRAVGAYIDRIKAEPTQSDIDEILVPGEPEALTREQHEGEGIPLSEGTKASLDRLANAYEIPRISD